MKKTYSVDKWSVQELADLRHEKKIIIPTFQRVFVWDEKRQKKFIESLRAGYPFGTLLVYKNKDGKHTMIDGLQRTTTILSYFKNPKDYFSKEFLLQEEKVTVLSAEYKSTSDIIRSEIESWFKSLPITKIDDLDERVKFSEISLLDFLNNKFSKNKRGSKTKNNHNLFKTLASIMDDIKSGYKIESSAIPVIIYEGSEASLPLVFGLLNKQGKALTTYEILGATLSGRSMSLPEDEMTKRILEKVEKRSDSYRALGYVYEGDKDENDVDEDGGKILAVNPFQYLYGLGKLLAEKYPTLFGESEADDFDVDSFAFNLICLYYKKDVTEMKDVIIDNLASASASEIAQLQMNIDVACASVHSILRPYIDFRLSSKNKDTKFISPHSEYQIIAYIAGMHHVLQTNDKNKIREYGVHLKGSYVYDILAGKWSGTGNTKALDWVKGKTLELTRGDWEHNLQSWLDDQNSQKEKKRSSQGKDAMLLLNYIYVTLLTHEEATNEIVYELDHLVPVKKLSNLIDRQAHDGVSINSVANVALIPKSLNRRKKDKTIYEAGLPKNQLQKLEKFTLTTEADLVFAGGESELLSVAAYNDFLNKRSIKIKEVFLGIVDGWK